MKLQHQILALVFSSGLLWTEAHAANVSKAACHLNKIKLVCAEEPHNGGEVLNAMANPESQRLLNALKTRPHVYSSNAERETFRISLEENRKIVVNYADQSLKRLKAKRLDEAGYAEVRAEFQAAMNTYWAGMAHYWSESWHGGKR